LFDLRRVPKENVSLHIYSPLVIFISQVLTKQDAEGSKASILRPAKGSLNSDSFSSPPSRGVDYLSSSPRTNFDIELLKEEIGERVAVIDACLPPQLAEDLRERGVRAVWVPAIMGDGASDEEIYRQLLISNWQLSYFRDMEKVLLTRDVEFYRKVRKMAILVSKHYQIQNSRQELSAQDLSRSMLRKMRQLSS